MSILIKGMKMPNNCLRCRFNGGGMDDIIYCELLDDYFESKKDCPLLVEVPEPHGRLIDADKLCEYAHNSTVGIDVNDICRFPCVIEAEEQDHE